MDADALVDQALQSMDRGDYESARQLLKEAASLAPLRADIRELLVEAIENSSTRARRAKTPQTPIGKASNRGARREPPEPTSQGDAASGGARVSIPQGAFGSRRRRSPWLLARTVLACVLFTGLVALGAYIWQFAGQEGDFGASQPFASNATPTPTPDPLEGERARMLSKAERLADARNYEAAIKEMKALLGTNPPEPKAYQERLAHYHFMQGRAEYKNGRVNQAIEHLERAVEYDIQNPKHFLWLGMSHYKRGRIRKGSLAIKDLSAARQMFERVIDLDPSEMEGYKYLAQTLIAQGKPVEGANAYRKIIARTPDSPEAEHARKQLKMMGMR